MTKNILIAGFGGQGSLFAGQHRFDALQHGQEFTIVQFLRAHGRAAQRDRVITIHAVHIRASQQVDVGTR